MFTPQYIVVVVFFKWYIIIGVEHADFPAAPKKAAGLTGVITCRC